MKRAVYYVSRLISGQKEKEFHGNFQDKHQTYDLIKIIILNLGNLEKKGTSHRLLNLLNLQWTHLKCWQTNKKIKKNKNIFR